MIRSPEARARCRRILVRAASLLLLAVPAIAQGQPSCGAPNGVRDSRRWPAPLGRLVTLHGRDLALRDALDRLAVAARLRLSYATELLALDRRVCVSYDSVAAGVVLTDLLDGAPVSPVVAGDDQVVLAPAPGPVQRRAVERDDHVNVLDRIVVTGKASAPPNRGLTNAVDVIDRAQLARQPGSTLSQTLNGAIPGFWLWEQAPASLLAQYGSLRGASSFQVSYPKIYVDGIEVANPLLFTEMSPDAVERIEVIRGPQGAALYGADAIGGVINIIMRHDGNEGGETGRLRGSAGVAQSAFASRPVLVQEHTLSVRGGGDLRSSSISLALGSVGSYVPGGQSWSARGDGGFRLVGERTMLTGTARLYAKDAGQGTSPLLSASTPFSTPQMDRQWRGGSHDADRMGSPESGSSTPSVREYTLGTTATYFANDGWTHALTLGIDGYRLNGGSMSASSLVSSLADSVLRAARGGADRLTVRASSEGHFGSRSGAEATLSFAAEHSALQQQSPVAALPLGDRYREYAGWQSNTGVVGQMGASWRNALFATGGLRVERNDGLAATPGLTSLPMLGAAAVHDFGLVTTKLRASYGRSSRPAGSVVRASWLARDAVVQGTLAPEEQSGLELGVDASIGRLFSLHLTRFDQTAYNLIQPVAITSQPPLSPNEGRTLYALQNVGEISNRGWELESALASGPLSLTGTLSLVDSRVRRLALGYGGDLQAGDRMLGVPAWTSGLTMAWTAPRWSTSLTVARAADWLNYDALSLAAASAAGHPVIGLPLRDYWRSYPGVTRIDASFSRRLFGGIDLRLTGRNLLDIQRGEPDNLTVLPGRTITAGLEVKF